MKRISFKPFLQWFGFTRRERRASFILLVLIVLVTGFRYIIPQRNVIIEEIPVKEGTVKSGIEGAKTVTHGQKFSEKGISHQSLTLELNTCDSASLEALPGIGPVLSARIIKFRKLLGGYARIEQLKEVYGLSEEVFNLISSRFYVDTLKIRKILINSAEFKDLARLPYLESHEVTSILRYRELQGNIHDMSDLTENNLLSSETAAKVGPYLDFRK